MLESIPNGNPHVSWYIYYSNKYFIFLFEFRKLLLKFCFSKKKSVQTEESNKVALIQVATHTDAYLLDMINLKLDENDKRLLSRIFLTNKKIIKLGYGFSQDIKIILQTIGCPGEGDAFRQTSLDLAYLVDQVIITIKIYFN